MNPNRKELTNGQQTNTGTEAQTHKIRNQLLKLQHNGADLIKACYMSYRFFFFFFMNVPYLRKTTNNVKQQIFIHSEKAIRTLPGTQGHIKGPRGKGDDNLFSPH